jgi:hypothetical protein
MISPLNRPNKRRQSEDLFRSNILLPCKSTGFISIATYVIYVQSATSFTEKQVKKLTQVSATANEEALLEVVTVYADFYRNALYEIQQGASNSILLNEDFANMHITENTGEKKSATGSCHVQRIQTICKVLMDRMFSTGPFNRVLHVSKSGSISTLEEMNVIIGANHKGWMGNQLLQKILNGKLQIGTTKWLNLGTLYAKIKGKNLVTFFHLTIDWSKVLEPSMTFGAYILLPIHTMAHALSEHFK